MRDKDDASSKPDIRKGALPAPTPPAAPDASPPLSLEEQVKAKESELAAMKQEKRLALLQAEIDQIKNGGRSALQVDIERKKFAIREKTFVEEVDGKKVAKYLCPDKSYMPDFPGKGACRLLPENSIVTVDYESLPGLNWQPVQKVPTGPAMAFAAKAS